MLCNEGVKLKIPVLEKSSYNRLHSFDSLSLFSLFGLLDSSLRKWMKSTLFLFLSHILHFFSSIKSLSSPSISLKMPVCPSLASSRFFFSYFKFLQVRKIIGFAKFDYVLFSPSHFSFLCLSLCFSYLFLPEKVREEIREGSSWERDEENRGGVNFFSSRPKEEVKDGVWSQG